MRWLGGPHASHPAARGHLLTSPRRLRDDHGRRAPSALVAAFNETEEQGVLGVADLDGRWELRLEAQVGDAVSYFYFLSDGSRSAIADLVVPTP